MTLLADFDWQAATLQTTSSTYAQSPEISPYLFKNTLVFPKLELSMCHDMAVGIENSLKIKYAF
jgi:hypothetical protein